MSRIFGREYRIEISDDTGVRKVFDSSKSPTPLQIYVDLETTFGNAFSLMQLTIVNLNKESIAQIEQDLNIVVQLGYKGSLGVVFEGKIVNFQAPQVGTERLLEMYCWSGLREQESKIATVSYGKDANYSDIVDFIAQDLFGKPPVYIGFDDDFKNGMGKAIAGYSEQEPHGSLLDKLGKDFGFEWTVEFNTVVLFERGKFRPGEPRLISAETGLVGGVSLTFLGADIETKLMPDVQVGDRVKIQSRSSTVNFSAIYNVNLPKEKTTIGDGAYVVKALRRTGDFYGDIWSNELICWREGEAGVANGLQ